MRTHWLAALGLVVAACGAESTTAVEWWSPAPGVTWQIQLQGEVDIGGEAGVFEVDLIDTPLATITELQRRHRGVVCYFSAGTHEDWRPDASAYPEEVLGSALLDWPGERWVDIRRLDLLGPLLEARLDLAVSKGCDAVDPDNVDGFANVSGFDLTAGDQLAFNRWLADEAHARGLGVALKNDLTQIPDLVEWFDFAVNEECFAYDECDLLAPFAAAHKAILAIDYSGDRSVCDRAAALGLSLVFADSDLAAPSTPCA